MHLYVPFGESLILWRHFRCSTVLSSGWHEYPKISVPHRAVSDTWTHDWLAASCCFYGNVLNHYVKTVKTATRQMCWKKHTASSKVVSVSKREMSLAQRGKRGHHHHGAEWISCANMYATSVRYLLRLENVLNRLLRSCNDCPKRPTVWQEGWACGKSKRLVQQGKQTQSGMLNLRQLVHSVL